MTVASFFTVAELTEPDVACHATLPTVFAPAPPGVCASSAYALDDALSGMSADVLNAVPPSTTAASSPTASTSQLRKTVLRCVTHQRARADIRVDPFHRNHGVERLHCRVLTPAWSSAGRGHHRCRSRRRTGRHTATA